MSRSRSEIGGSRAQLDVAERAARRILTRATGYLRTVCSHSLQPYRGCAFGRALCGQYCYVQHNGWLTRGAPWGSFLEARVNAAECYAREAAVERRWARRARGAFAIFMSSSTDPFVPHEDRFRVTRAVLEAMCDDPPDELILQTHTHRAAGYVDLYRRLAARCALRIHITIESDRDRLPGLPAPASPIERRFAAAAELRAAGIRVVVTVSPLLPLAAPEQFFARIAQVADAVVLDHFIGGDGTADGSRTRRTTLPAAIARVDAAANAIDYLERMVGVAESVMPGRVGVGCDGFAGRLRPAPR